MPLYSILKVKLSLALFYARTQAQTPDQSNLTFIYIWYNIYLFGNFLTKEAA